MKRGLFLSLFILFCLAGLGVIPLFAQEAQTQGAPSATESEVQWLWGEVVSVDILAKQMIVKYLDYETDTEKEITINIDDKTNFENAQSWEGIKTQDTVSVDYVTNLDGKNIAKNISVEKNEAIENMPEEGKDQPKVAPALE